MAQCDIAKDFEINDVKTWEMMENVFSQQSLSGLDRHCQHQQPEAHLNHIPSLVWQRMTYDAKAGKVEM